MRAEDNNFIGYVQLYMKFWMSENPKCAFFATFNTDFSKPLTDEVLNGLLQKTGECIEKINKVSLTGTYVSKEQYLSECKQHASEFNTAKCEWSGEKTRLSVNQTE